MSSTLFTESSSVLVQNGTCPGGRNVSRDCKVADVPVHLINITIYSWCHNCIHSAAESKVIDKVNYICSLEFVIRDSVKTTTFQFFSQVCPIGEEEVRKTQGHSIANISGDCAISLLQLQQQNYIYYTLFNHLSS